MGVVGGGLARWWAWGWYLAVQLGMAIAVGRGYGCSVSNAGKGVHWVVRLGSPLACIITQLCSMMMST
jgi:hypothetical protein